MNVSHHVKLKVVWWMLNFGHFNLCYQFLNILDVNDDCIFHLGKYILNFDDLMLKDKRFKKLYSKIVDLMTLKNGNVFLGTQVDFFRNILMKMDENGDLMDLDTIKIADIFMNCWYSKMNDKGFKEYLKDVYFVCCLYLRVFSQLKDFRNVDVKHLKLQVGSYIEGARTLARFLESDYLSEFNLIQESINSFLHSDDNTGLKDVKIKNIIGDWFQTTFDIFVNM